MWGTMKLYDMTGAPNPRRVRIFLAEKGINIEKVEIDVMGGENLQREYLAINPRGIVPTLEFEDGSIIDESSAICRYFEEIKPEPALYGTDAVSKASIEAWIRRIDLDCYYPGTEILRNSNPAFENRAVAGLENTPQIPALVERGKKRVAIFYDQFNEHLNGREFVVGDEFSAADIVALCTVDFLEQYAGFSIAPELTALAAWYDRSSMRQSANA